MKTAPSFDRDAVCSHIEMLHSLAASSNVDGVMTLTCIDMKENVTTERFAIGDSQNMIASIMAREAHLGLNIYAPWAVFQKSFPRGSKGAESHVVAALAFVGDLDADTGKAGNGLPIPSPYTLETSAGNAQPVFPLARALPVNEAKPIAIALADAIGADSRTKDTSGLWRIPGTLNWPTKTKLDRGRSPSPQLVKIQHAWTGELIEPEKIIEAVEHYANHPKQQERKQSSAGNSEGFKDLPAGLKKQIASPPYSGEDQSQTAASVFAQLFCRGWSNEQIIAIMEEHPNGIGKRYAEGKELAGDVERTREKFDQGSADNSSQRSAKPKIAATPWTWRDPASIPRREFLCGTHLIRKFGAGTIAHPGVGKSALVLGEALALACGRDLHGIAPRHRCRVWYWNGEDPQEETDRRVAAACTHFGIKRTDLEGWFFSNSGRDQEIVIAKQTRDGAVIVEPVAEALIATIQDNRIDVVMIDPFISSHRVTENDNNAIDMVAKRWTKIADVANCAIDLVHHSKKTGGAAVTVEDGRGAVALLAAVRSARVLNVMSTAEAEKAGISLARRTYFRSENGKANLSPPPEGADWFCIKSVALGNGDSSNLLDTGDNVGVVTAWQWPDFLASVSVADFDQSAQAIRKGKWRENPQAKDWVGRAVADALNLDVQKRTERARVVALLKLWVGAGSLRVVEAMDTKSNLRKFVEVSDAVDD